MGKRTGTIKHKAKGASGQSYYSLDVCVSVAQRRSKSKTSGAHKVKQKVCR